MKLGEALRNTRIIRYSTGSPAVVETVASLLMDCFPEMMELRGNLNGDESGGVLHLEVSDEKAPLGLYFRITEDGSGALCARNTCHIYSYVCDLIENRLDDPVEKYSEGQHIELAFDWNRISYDYFLTQEGRIQKELDRETYVASLARLGFTHVEVNGLASPMGLETGLKGEIYPMFYTYCPALDQFTFSELNKGLYPNYWLSGNMAFLKENARLVIKYGLIPGLLCFEPRSVPEKFFDRYPMLRGARVDHPFRSFKPRFNMTITHPLVLEHYSDMLTKIMDAVPELGFICIWSNDSGSGFENTRSLNAGRNGGAYLIRGRESDDEIARLAGENVIRFLSTLKEAGRKINLSFRVLTRMESFYGEHDTVWKGLGDGIDLETYSLITKGWDLPYVHPVYSEVRDINGGSIHQSEFWSEEMDEVKDLEQKGCRVNFYIAHGPHQMFEPLLGIPYPFITWEKLSRMYSAGVTNLAHLGGTCPPELVPYNINHEILRAFMFNPAGDADTEIMKIAAGWAGSRCAEKIVDAWKLTEQAILAYPNVSSLYSSLGFTWYRLWVRPLVPDIESLEPGEKKYYEDFMCTTPHNPNNVDLSRDVLFTLITEDKAAKDVIRIDENVWKNIDEAIEVLEEVECGEGAELVHDQLVRIKALRCWIMTSRNVAGWVSAVHGYLSSGNEVKKESCRAALRSVIEFEIENCLSLIELLDDEVEFMAMTDKGETPLVHGTNVKENLLKKIRIMQEHIDDEPYIDPEYIEKIAGKTI